MDALRLFLALPLDPHIQQALHAVQDTLKQTGADIRWVRTENLHLTIRFLGAVPSDRALALQDRLPDLLTGLAPFPLTVQGLGAFPPGQRPRIIWAGVDTDSGRQISEIAQRLNKGLLSLGWPAETRPFLAHITLGRARSSRNLPRLTTALEQDLLPAGLKQTVRAIILFQSTLDQQGPTYTPRLTIPLIS